MTGKSTLDPDNFPLRRGRKDLKGHDTNSLGPSDTSDSGSDVKGLGGLDHSDSAVNQDRDVDRVVRSDEAGLGGGLDQAEEAQLGVTDEELKKRPPRK